MLNMLKNIDKNDILEVSKYFHNRLYFSTNKYRLFKMNRIYFFKYIVYMSLNIRKKHFI